MEGFLLPFFCVDCCNKKQTGRVFNIPPDSSMQKFLIFLDSCKICGNSKALIIKVDFNGKYKKILEKSGKAAIKLFNKFYKCDTGIHKIKNGSKENMNWLWFDGLKDLWVRDLNNVKKFKL
jgi:hypothetical protein